MANITLAGIGKISTDAEGRYSLNDFHKASGGEKRHGPSYWLETEQAVRLAQILSDTGNSVSVIRGGRNQGTYVPKEMVYAYAMWISAEFQLKVIRAFDALVTGDIEKAQQIARPATKSSSEQIRFNMTIALNMAAMDSLNMALSGRLMQFKRIEQVFGLPATLPNYAEDNNGSANGSMEFASLTELLGEHQAGMSAKAANNVLLGIGFMKEATRPSNKSPDKIAKFKVIDGDGLKYGKNMSSTSNPRETQPMWYRETFSELLGIICENAKSAA